MRISAIGSDGWICTTVLRLMRPLRLLLRYIAIVVALAGIEPASPD